MANPKGKSQNENSAGSLRRGKRPASPIMTEGESTGSLQRGKRSGTSGPLASEGKANRGKSQTASAERTHSRKDVRFDKGKVNPSRNSFKPQGRGSNKAAGSKGGIRRQGSKR